MYICITSPTSTLFVVSRYNDTKMNAPGLVQRREYLLHSCLMIKEELLVFMSPDIRILIARYTYYYEKLKNIRSYFFKGKNTRIQ